MGYYCSVCKEVITKREYQYSKDNFDKALCRKHQKGSDSNENQSSLAIATNESNRLFVPLVQKGWHVESESYDGYKHVDLSIPDAKVDIEVDG